MVYATRAACQQVAWCLLLPVLMLTSSTASADPPIEIRNSMTRLQLLSDELFTARMDLIEFAAIGSSDYAVLVRKDNNIRAVLTELRGATIQFGNLPRNTTAQTNTRVSPPVITYNIRYRNDPPEAMAASLAHEACHIMFFNNGYIRNSVDEEEHCYNKSAEVWAALKRPGQRFKTHDRNLERVRQGSATLRAWIRERRPGLPRHNPRRDPGD